MKCNIPTLLAGTALCFVFGITGAQAQDAGTKPPPDSPQQSVNASDVPDSNAIIVTARRREEVIQDVPLTVQATSGNALEKLDLRQFDDLGKVIAGISLDKSENAITMRGVSFNVLQRTNPTVSTYINEAPLQSTFLFQSLFDVGQIEVLKGPQGTLRGQSAPTGAIILTTRQPDLYEVGGFGAATITDQDGRMVQGGVNMPVIDGKFALRVAAMYDHNNDGGVKSVNNPDDPYSNTRIFRATARIEPVDGLSATIMYQDLLNRQLDFGVAGGPDTALIGSGAPAGTIKAGGYALPFVRVAGSNGPVISEGDNTSVTEFGDKGRTRQQLVTAHVDYQIAGQKLSYVGAWSNNRNTGCCAYGDKGNLISGDYSAVNVATDLTRWSHELRLSSVERIANIFDYVVGVFHERENTNNNIDTGPVAFLPGAFGSPLGAPIAGPPNTDYTISVNSLDVSHNTEWSYFANVVAHIDSRTELSGGLRFIDNKLTDTRTNTSSAARVAVALPIPCAFVHLTASTLYPGACETAIPSSITTDDTSKRSKPVVYSATLSHHFTPDLLAYASFGTSWRPGPVQSFINGASDPTLQGLTELKDESTKSYEAGFKTTIWNNRLTFDVAYFHQDYKNLVFTGGTVPYLADPNGSGCTAAGSCSVNSATNLLSNIDAKVDGIDADFSFVMNDHWNISGGISWANGRYSNQLVPCNDGNFDGIPDTITPTVADFTSRNLHIAQCKTSDKSSPTSTWNGTLQSEYTQPLTGEIDGFISGLLTYRPKNPNLPGSPYTTPAYALVDMHAGIRSPKGNWTLEVFAKNIFNDRTVLTRGFTDVASSGLTNVFGPSGYSTISYVLPREVGVTLRVALGSK